MLRAFEVEAVDIFQGQRVLELGAGVGLLSLCPGGGSRPIKTIGFQAFLPASPGEARASSPFRRRFAARSGAKEVHATDGSPRAVRLLRRSVRATQLDWLVVAEGGRASAAARLQAMGLRPPFDVVICAALGYVALETFKALLCVLDLAAWR